MSGRLAEIEGRITGIRQLGTVVNAMRGIAAARAQQARGQLAAVDSYAAVIAGAIGRILATAPAPEAGRTRPGRTALILFCAEQGFAGAFSERILDAVAGELTDSALFLIGTRGQMLARERGIETDWAQDMPAHTAALPRLADQIVETLAAPIATGHVDRLDVVFTDRRPGGSMTVVRRRLLPFDFHGFAPVASALPPLVHLPAGELLADLAAEYVHAQLCNAALHAFAAENDARMEAMAAAKGQIDRQLDTLQATQRRVRQDEITAEIIELAAGETASNGG